MDFRITGLSPAPFQHLHDLGNEELAQHRALRRVAIEKPGYPCRVTLEDAEPGEPVILVNYEHLPVDSPYRASHAIYVRASATRAYDRVNEVPPALRTRLLSLRAYDAQGLMVACDVVEGWEAEMLILRLLGKREVAYIHAHYARAGCYAARIDRA